MLENRRRLSTGPEELAWQLPGAWVWRCRNLRTAGRAATRQERAGSSRYRSRHRGPLCVEQARSTAELEVQRPMVQQSESRHRSERTRRSLLENVACSSRGSGAVRLVAAAWRIGRNAGEPPADAKVVDDRPCPPGRKPPGSLRTIRARQFQALVRPLPRAGRSSIVVARDFGLARSFANLISQDATYFLTYARSTAALRRALRVRSEERRVGKERST